MDIFDQPSGAQQDGYLTGQLLIAMPTMSDPRFAKSVIYMCVHNDEGAMGLVVNKLVDSLTFPELLDQLDIESFGVAKNHPVHYGGPVESGRGFVLHTLDYTQSGTIVIGDEVGLTATIDVLRDMAENRGPERCMLALGYAGWGSGQLDGEIQQNAWLNVPADEGLIFDRNLDDKWERSIAKIGIDLRLLSGESGRA